MAIAKVFKSGNSQAVRLPKEFRVKSSVLEIVKVDDGILLREPYRGIERAFEILANLPDDFLLERDDPPPQKRRPL